MKIRSLLLGGAIAGSLVMAPSALALDAPTGIATASARNDQGPWTFTWTAVAPDGGDSLVGYEYALTDSAATPPASGTAVPGASAATPVPATARAFWVRAVETTGGPGPWSDLAIAPDYTPPSISYALTGTTLNGWYSALTITPTCSEPVTPASACSPVAWTTDGVFPAVDTPIVDAAGNTATAIRPGFSFDATPPADTDPQGQPAGQLLNPGPNALVASEPAFSWTKGYDATSGVDHYDVQVKKATDDGWTTIATVAARDDLGDYTATRNPALAPPMPTLTPLDWRVRVVDVAGHVYKTPSRRFKIDPTIPPAPTITGGPAAPTQQSSPTFTWTGTEDLYSWDLTAAGNDNPVRQGSGSARSVTINALPDGDYTFRVRQITAAQRPGADATRTFKVDTVAPAPPVITVRPSAPSIVAPTFAWQGEPGAYSRWTLTSSTGEVLQGPVDTPVTSVTLPALGDGSYTFQVQQIDAAGNVSAPTVEPFTVLAPIVPLNPNAALLSILPRQNATRLLPRAGKTVPTRRPVLQWSRGPRGTKLYNLQIFRVTKGRGKRAPRVTKVVSAFPKGRQLRAPKKAMLPGTCYVWRVWPYTGRVFTPKPVGVSNFCVASHKTLRKIALQTAARKKAARLRARALRH